MQLKLHKVHAIHYGNGVALSESSESFLTAESDEFFDVYSDEFFDCVDPMSRAGSSLSPGGVQARS